jgi:hypothetical protein
MTAALAAFAPRAIAMDAEGTAEGVGQFYDLRSPTGETVLARRRLTLTVGVSAYDLLHAPPGDPKAPNMSFRARFRYDADYGAASCARISGGNCGPTSDSSATDSFVPGFSPGLVDLMYAYVEGRRFLRGWLGFKLGRQYVTDVLGWWSMDGVELNLTTPFFLKAEAYGGLEQRGGMPLSTNRFEAPGIWRGDRASSDTSGRDPYPSFQPAAVAPALGVALESAGVTWIHGRLTYRRVYNTGASNVTEFASGLYRSAQYDSWRISSERVGYALDGSLATVGGFKGGMVYDFYRSEFTHAYASVDAYLGQRVTVGADYDYYVPSFDGDSIWNFFAGEPMNDVGVRANVDVSDQLSLAGGAHLRVFSVQTAPFDPGNGAQYLPSPNFAAAAASFPTNGHPFDEGGNLSARWRTGDTALGLHASGNFGGEGSRVGADVSGERTFETRYVVSGRAGVWQWDDKIRADRGATSFNYVAGLGYRVSLWAKASVEWEHDINRLVGQRFRVMAWLKLAIGK